MMIGLFWRFPASSGLLRPREGFTRLSPLSKINPAPKPAFPLSEKTGRPKKILHIEIFFTKKKIHPGFFPAFRLFTFASPWVYRSVPRFG
jgi:hypothetical protein